MINDQGSDVDQLVEWLGQQLDEDERIARAAKPGPWHSDGSVYATHPTDAVVDYSESAEHIAAWDPARVLHETDAKRELLRQYEHLKHEVMPDDLTGVWAFEAVLRAHAAVYKDRPGYREEWRP